MFDKEKPADLAALKTELTTDPASIGYSGANSTKQLLRLLNVPALNTTGATESTPVNDVTVVDVVGLIDSAEYDALSAVDKAWINGLMAQPVDTLMKPYRVKFLSLFANGSATRTAVLASLTKPASRAVELFGYGSEINRLDYIEARES